MTELVEVTDANAPLAALLDTIRARRPTWSGPVDERQVHAATKALEHGDPAGREWWRRTPLKVVKDVALTPTDPAGAEGLDQGVLAESPVSGAARLVFIDGHFAAALSTMKATPDGVTLMPLAAALVADDAPRPLRDTVYGCLATVAPVDEPDQAYAAQNTALFEDGAFVHVTKDTQVPVAVEVIHVATQSDAYRTPRTLVVVEPGAEASVVETFVGPTGPDAPGLTNAVTELVAQDNASLRYIKLQRTAAGGRHLHTVAGTAARDARLHTFVFDMGGRVARTDVRVELVAEGAEAHVDGLFLGDGDRHTEHATIIDHAKPHTVSRENYKGIVTGRSHGVFTGYIHVAPGAQKTDSDQHNKNLLLSDSAKVDTTPQLEIHADDVKCAHGSTIGRLDENAVFYLRSRGFQEADARRALTLAFAADVLASVKDDGLRAALDAWVAGWFDEHRQADQA